MMEIRARFIERIRRTSTVESFRFRSEPKLEFLPGQFLQIIFDEENKNNSNLNKFLSFSSGPGRDYFDVTKRLSKSEFSRALDGLKVGDSVLFKAPMGSCVFKDEYAEIAFLVGGIGITPVISILEYIIGRSLATGVSLLYFNRVGREVAFKSDIDEWSRKNPNIKPIYSFNDSRSEDRNSSNSAVRQLIADNVGGRKQPVIFIFGPPGMVTVMKNICLDIGFSESMIKAENFIGY